MSKQVKLSARPRIEEGRNAVKRVRARGAVPAIIYGGKEAPLNLEIDRRELDRLLSHAASEHILVELAITETDKINNRLSIIQDVQHHPVRGDVLHVDFHAISATEAMEAEVPIEPEGEPVGVRTYGGILQQLVHAIDLECLPQNLPEVIRVDVSALGVGEAIHVKDLILPEGVKALSDADVTVFLVSEPNVAEEAPAPAVAAAPEVLKEKKPETEAPAKK
jgi:large subunit ribosomal protein L25